MVGFEKRVLKIYRSPRPRRLYIYSRFHLNGLFFSSEYNHLLPSSRQTSRLILPFLLLYSFARWMHRSRDPVIFRRSTRRQRGMDFNGRLMESCRRVLVTTKRKKFNILFFILCEMISFPLAKSLCLLERSTCCVNSLASTCCQHVSISCSTS